MEIEKGYTLSQFVDKLDDLTRNEVEALEATEQDDLYELIAKYNEFLKQPLKKEMFVNEIENPKILNFAPGDHTEDCECINCTDGALERYNEAMIRFKEAGKKVIFKNVKWNGFLWIADDWYKFHIHECNSLGELFRKTNGELELKNLEI